MRLPTTIEGLHDPASRPDGGSQYCTRVIRAAVSRSQRRPRRSGRRRENRCGSPVLSADLLRAVGDSCLVLDGDDRRERRVRNTHALVEASRAGCGEPRCLNAAIELGRWIVGGLEDDGGAGFGGYFLGYADGGATRVPRRRVLGKQASRARRRHLFARSPRSLTATRRMPRSGLLHAEHAGRLRAVAMFDADEGRFSAGTRTHRGWPFTRDLARRSAKEKPMSVNTFDFVDSRTSAHARASRPAPAVVAMRSTGGGLLSGHAGREALHDPPPATRQVDGEAFRGSFEDLVFAEVWTRRGPWQWRREFTGQMVVAMRLGRAREFSAPDLATSADAYLAEIRRAHASARVRGRGEDVCVRSNDRRSRSAPAHRPMLEDAVSIDIPGARRPRRRPAWAVLAEADFDPLQAPRLE